MSTGFSGNLGFNIPFDWAFDQFATVTLNGGNDGTIEIDKNGYSGRNRGVSQVSSNLNLGEPIGLDNFNTNPVVLINRSGTSIPVYSSKISGGQNHYTYTTSGSLLGEIEPGAFYTRYFCNIEDPMNPELNNCRK